jgi:hypothetical protein
MLPAAAIALAACQKNPAHAIESYPVTTETEKQGLVCDGCGKLIGAHGIGFKCTHGCDIDFCDECKDIVEEAVAKAGVESEPEELYRKVSALPVGASINVLGRDKIGMPYVKGKCTRKSDMEFECTWSDDGPNEIFKLVGDEDGIKNEFLLEYIKEDKKRSPEGGNGRKNAGGSPARRKKARQNEGGAEADGDADMVRLHASSQNAIQKLQDTDTSLSHLSLSGPMAGVRGQSSIPRTPTLSEGPYPVPRPSQTDRTPYPPSLQLVRDQPARGVHDRLHY